MKTSTSLKPLEYEKEFADALRARLGEIPFVKIRNLEFQKSINLRSIDLLATLNIKNTRWKLACELKNSGQPAVIRPVIAQLKSNVDIISKRGRAYGVFIAPYVSPRAAAICIEEGVGYLDLAGNCRLSFDRVYVRMVGEKNRVAARRDARSLYSPKAACMLRVLMTEPRRKWKVQELAREAQISLGQASNVKKLLADRDWISSMAQGFLLSQPETLLLEWAENQPRQPDRRSEFYSLKPVPELERGLAEVCDRLEIRYALAGFSAAMRMAPMVRNQKVTAYVSRISAELKNELGLKPVPSGANVVLIEPADEGVFYGTKTINGVVTVSPVQAYIDLKNNPARGEEAAEAILTQILRPQW